MEKRFTPTHVAQYTCTAVWTPYTFTVNSVYSVNSVYRYMNSVYSVFSEAKVVDDMPGRAVWTRCSIKLLMSHLTGPD